MSNKIKEITEGFHQYYAHVHDDMYENSVEYLEYHNDYGAWDRELNIETSRIYLKEDLLSSIAQVMETN